MRRTEAHQGVRMIKFSSILARYEAAEFSQLEAAELLASGNGLSVAGVSGLRTKARPVCWTVGWQGVEQASSTGSQRRGRGVVSHALRGLHGQAFPRASVKDHLFGWGYTWTKKFCTQRLAGEGQASRGASAQAGAPAVAGMMLHQDASTHVWLAASRRWIWSSRWTMRRAPFCRRFWRPKRALPRRSGAGGGIWPAWSAAELLYRSGQPLFSHAGSGREGRPHAPDASGPGAGASGVEHIAAYSPQARGRSERVFHTLQTVW